MPPDRLPTHGIGFLEEIRAIAQLGLHYTKDPYDRERFERLLTLAARKYDELGGFAEGETIDWFRTRLTSPSPAVGLDAAIFSPDGRLLLMKRSDELNWCVPGGAAEAGERAEEGIRREVREEVGLEVEVREIITVRSRLPGEFGMAHTLYNLMFHCEILSGTPTISPEAIEVGWFDPREITNWHANHQDLAEAAMRYAAERLNLPVRRPSGGP